MVHFCLDGRGVPHEESDRGDLSEEEVDEEDDVLEDFGGDIGGSPENNSYILITFVRNNSYRLIIFVQNNGYRLNTFLRNNSFRQKKKNIDDKC